MTYNHFHPNSLFTLEGVVRIGLVYRRSLVTEAPVMSRWSEDTRFWISRRPQMIPSVRRAPKPYGYTDILCRSEITL